MSDMYEAGERLRAKAREYELNKLAAEERGDRDLAIAWACVTITLYELARVLDPDSDETEEQAA